MEPVKPPTKPCHNCRRQRLRCDRSYPHCNKCITAGKECLGYGKLFRWTGAVASRGKLAGRTSSAPVDGLGGGGAKPVQMMSFATSTHPPSVDSSCSMDSPDSTPQTPQTPQSSEDMQLIPLSPSASSSVASPWVLADPLFQDMQHSHRYYLSYCKLQYLIS